jgi:hypothetical protein
MTVTLHTIVVPGISQEAVKLAGTPAVPTPAVQIAYALPFAIQEKMAQGGRRKPEDERVAFLHLRDAAGSCGLARNTLLANLKHVSSVVRTDDGTAYVTRHDKGEAGFASSWMLTGKTEASTITSDFPLDHRGLAGFFHPSNPWWSSKQVGHQGWRLLLTLLARHGATDVSVSSSQAADLLGCTRRPATYTLARLASNQILSCGGTIARAPNKPLTIQLGLILHCAIAANYGRIEGDLDRNKRDREDRMQWLVRVNQDMADRKRKKEQQ